MDMEVKTKTKRQKTVYGKFSDIAHIFANEPGREVRCRNGFVEDDVLYSYGRHFPVAKRYTDTKGNTTIFFTLDTYSRITGKHINEASAATRHLNKLYMKNVPRFDTVDHSNNIGYWLVELKTAFTNIKKARTNKEWRLTEMRKHLTTLKVYLDFLCQHQLLQQDDTNVNNRYKQKLQYQLNHLMNEININNIDINGEYNNEEEVLNGGSLTANNKRSFVALLTIILSPDFRLCGMSDLTVIICKRLSYEQVLINLGFLS